MSTRLPLCVLSTSTLSDSAHRLITTELFGDGPPEIDPQGLFTETRALGSTLKCYSLRASATRVPATMAPTATSFTVRLLIRIPRNSFPECLSWLNRSFFKSACRNQFAQLSSFHYSSSIAG